MNSNQLYKLRVIAIKLAFLLIGFNILGCSTGGLIIEEIGGEMAEKKVQYYVNGRVSHHAVFKKDRVR
jgi:hypothetical protein